MPQDTHSRYNKATEALMWNFYMDQIYSPYSDTWRNYWSQFKHHFLKRNQYFCLREVEGRDLPFDQWSYMELTTEGKDGKRIEIINDVKHRENSKIRVYDRKTYKLEEVLTPNFENIPITEE